MLIDNDISQIPTPQADHLQKEELHLFVGINALAEYTMINGEANMCYAISKEQLKSSGAQTDKKYGSNALEIWRYNPLLLSNGKAVDKLSLYLTL